MEEQEIREHIVKLLDSQLLAALSTVKRGQPYVNLIAYAVASNLEKLLFATPQPTRKYSNLLEESRVSLLVDSRGNRENDFHEASAVTIMGEAHEADTEELERYKPVFIARHPYLEKFVCAPTTSLFIVQVKHYIMVSHFQRVMELHLSDEDNLFI